MIVAKINVAHYELAVVFENRTNFLELTFLFAAHVLEETQRGHEVETARIECNSLGGDVNFAQILGRLMNRDVNTVIADVGFEQNAQSTWSTPDIEQAAILSCGHLIDDAGALKKAEARFCILTVFSDPIVSWPEVFHFHKNITSLQCQFGAIIIARAQLLDVRKNPIILLLKKRTIEVRFLLDL